jgi:ubiquinone/menaquinone biosynthesis C-methylase UbiE
VQSKEIDKVKARIVWGSTPAGTTFGGGAEPGTKEFFENVLKKRSTYELPFLFELIPSSSFRGMKVLEVGCGAGYDAYEFCRNGADYIGIDIAPENIERTKKHLSFYGYFPTILEGDAENLQFENDEFDVVFSNGVLHHTPDIEKSFKEAYRVLKKNGEFWVILYHKNSFFYWLTLFLISHILLMGFLKRSIRERLSMIEFTASDELPLVNVYSRRILRKHLKNAGFNIEKLWIRRLIREDFPMSSLPYVAGFLKNLWLAIPQRWLNFLGKRFGWYVIARARKM